MSQALALGGAGNESGQVRDDERAMDVHPHDAELGRPRGEWVVGDFRPRRADAREKRRLAGIGEADHADVGEELQLESQPASVSGAPQVRLAGRAIGGRREAGVATATAGAGLDENSLTGSGEIAERLGGGAVGHHCADPPAPRPGVATPALARGTPPLLAALPPAIAG